MFYKRGRPALTQPSPCVSPSHPCACEEGGAPGHRVGPAQAAGLQFPARAPGGGRSPPRAVAPKRRREGGISTPPLEQTCTAKRKSSCEFVIIFEPRQLRNGALGDSEGRRARPSTAAGAGVSGGRGVRVPFRRAGPGPRPAHRPPVALPLLGVVFPLSYFIFKNEADISFQTAPQNCCLRVLARVKAPEHGPRLRGTVPRSHTEQPRPARRRGAGEGSAPRPSVHSQPPRAESGR